MPLANEIRKQLAEYTSGKLSVEEFRAWFASVLRDVHKSGEADAEKLAHAVEWEFSDFSNRGVPEGTLKHNLSRLANVAVANPPESRSLRVEEVVFLELVVSAPKAYVFAQASGTRNGLESFANFGAQNPEQTVTLSNMMILNPA